MSALTGFLLFFILIPLMILLNEAFNFIYDKIWRIKNGKE